MKKELKIWHFLLLFFLLIYALRYKVIFETCLLIISFLSLFFSDFSFASSQINLSLIDQFFSFLIVLFTPLFLFFKRKTFTFLYKNLRFNSAVLILLAVFFLTAPILVNFHPDFHKNIAVTKLLPPLSTKEVIHLKNPAESINDKESSFIHLKNSVIKNSFNDFLLFADSIKKANEEIIYFQKKQSYSLNKEKYYATESKLFLLGTDEYGRDIFSRLIYGTRISITVGVGAVFITFFIGIFLGFISGFSGGFIDSVLNRFTEMFLSFPLIFLIILVIALFGNSILMVIVILGFSGWMSLFKVTRGEVLSIKKKDFFITAAMTGLSKKDLLLKEVLPVISAPVIVNLIFQFSNVILAEAALSFLGLGTGSYYPSWGAMIEEGQGYLTRAWWMIFFPGFFLFITLFAANNFGREINIYFNPRLEKR